MSTCENVGYKLMVARHKAGATQKDVSLVTGITEASLSRYENGSRIPKVTTAKKLCDLYGIKIDDLFGENTNGYKKLERITEINKCDTSEPIDVSVL